MAPTLRRVIREALERKEVSGQNITLYLKKLPNLDRYDRAFRSFWCFCTHRGKNPITMSVEDLALELGQFDIFSTHEARHAYSAMILLPQLQPLRFVLC
jgi:hypothetical protein